MLPLSLLLIFMVVRSLPAYFFYHFILFSLDSHPTVQMSVLLLLLELYTTLK